MVSYFKSITFLRLQLVLALIGKEPSGKGVLYIFWISAAALFRSTDSSGNNAFPVIRLSTSIVEHLQGLSPRDAAQVPLAGSASATCSKVQRVMYL